MVFPRRQQILTLLATDLPEQGQVRILNNSPQSYTINDLAEMVGAEASAMGFSASIARDRYNPRFEDGVAYCAKTETRYLDEKLTPTPLRAAISESLGFLAQFRCEVNLRSIEPTHTW